MNMHVCADWLRQRWPWIVLSAALAGLALWLGPQVWRIARDEAALRAAIAELGWLGPLALILINVLQIVIAPIPGYVMQAVAGDELDPAVEQQYLEVVHRHAPEAKPPQRIDRFAFYERARSAYAVVMTGETRKYGNLLLKKGVTAVEESPGR